MKLEQQVTSLEISKRLKELGVKQKSLLCWYEWDDKSVSLQTEIVLDENSIDGYSAFTVAELGEMLPHGVETGKTSEGQAFCGYHNGNPNQSFGITEKTEADARGKMLIYLEEHKKQV